MSESELVTKTKKVKEICFFEKKKIKIKIIIITYLLLTLNLRKNK